jgi:hypothetical protein
MFCIAKSRCNIRSLNEIQQQQVYDFLLFLKYHQRAGTITPETNWDILSFEGILKDKTNLNSVDLQHKAKEYWSKKHVSD